VFLYKFRHSIHVNTHPFVSPRSGRVQKTGKTTALDSVTDFGFSSLNIEAAPQSADDAFDGDHVGPVKDAP
jgi:hypothetical protein